MSNWPLPPDEEEAVRTALDRYRTEGVLQGYTLAVGHNLLQVEITPTDFNLWRGTGHGNALCDELMEITGLQVRLRFIVDFSN
jgi:hypothetical protein